MPEKRESLKPLVGKKHKVFVGTVYEIREDPGSDRKLAMLIDIYMAKNGRYVTDHVWVYFSKAMERAGAVERSRIQFEAQAYKYSKWLRNGLFKKTNVKTYDYGLKSVRKVQVLNTSECIVSEESVAANF
jgi:hypothetical protein